MKQRPKRTPGELESKAGRALRTALEYHALAIVQRPFGFVFWLIEQRKSRLQDRIELAKWNEGGKK